MKQAPKLIRPKIAAERLSLSKATIYRLIQEDPSFPRPVKIGMRSIAFIEEEVDAYAWARINARAPAPQTAA